MPLAQGSSGYLIYDPGSRRFELPPEQAMVFARYDQAAFEPAGPSLRPLTLPPTFIQLDKSWGNVRRHKL